ncbi:MAG: glucose-6-phosphate dehydrogenase [Actinomycetota bacterium]
MELKRPEPQVVVLFGASGDLTGRKAMPAFYNLYCQNLLPERFAIVGYGRSEISDDHFRQKMQESIAVYSRTGLDKAAWQQFERHLCYVSGSYSDDSAMRDLALRLKEIDNDFATEGRRLFYCATPPSAFPSIARSLGEAGLGDESRIVVEKPFGYDLKSAIELNQVLHEVFHERQIFRIDHYLGKETVQNILVFRFANGMFEPIWNRHYVSSIQIEVAESVGIEGRGSFYEDAGATRDIVQNHMIQLLATLAMEPPASFDAEAIRNEKVKVLRSLHPFDPRNMIKGQYTAGEIDGRPVRGYQDETDVPPGSTTETFIALRAEIENWRWAGVPFYLRTGKRLPRRATTVTVFFQDAPFMMFGESGIDRPEDRPTPNHLTLRIQPDEGITLTFDAKVPGPDMKVAPVNMDFDYDESFTSRPAEAYERLLHDAMMGDATLFTRADEIERAWEVVDPVLAKSRPLPYWAGTWGPPAAEGLVAPAKWRLG